MSRFIPVDRDTSYLLPPSVDEWLPENHLARFVVEVIDPLDLSKLTRQYAGRGSAAHHPSVLLGLLVYGYATGVFSSRKPVLSLVEGIEAQLRSEVQTLLAKAEAADGERLADGVDLPAEVARGNGVLKITGAKLLAANGWIDSLAFEVEIRPPVDPGPALRKKFLPEWPEYGTIEEACPGVATPIRIGKTDYHDFDGDGFDAAAVLAYSCLVGTGGADLPGVFTRSASGEVVEMEIGEIPSGDQKIREGLRGKVDLKVEHGILVKEFPVYRDEDPNCCPTGGARRFSCRWDGQAFVLDKFEDLPAEPNP